MSCTHTHTLTIHSGSLLIKKAAISFSGVKLMREAVRLRKKSSCFGRHQKRLGQTRGAVAGGQEAECFKAELYTS